MQRPRLGEILSRLVPLSLHDVEEILQEQRSSRRRFGDIALAWGLCEPQHVWSAFFRQLADRPLPIDLETFGIDAQAVNLLPRELIGEYRVIPVRVLDDQRLVLAVSADAYAKAATELPAQLERGVSFVLADERQIDRAIESYCPMLAVGA